MPYDNEQSLLFETIGFTGAPDDQYAHDLFWQIMYDDNIGLDARMAAAEQLQEYLGTEYGLDFSEQWDWDAFREWYDAAA